MNDTHGTFISQIRPKKASDADDRRLAHIERSRKRSQTNLSSLSLAQAPHPTWDSDVQEEPQMPPRESLSRQGSDYGVSTQYVNMTGEGEQRRSVVQGMHRILHWKQASYDATLNRPFHISPPQTPTNSRSWSSSTSLASDMSEEQMEHWLECPVDAELHRYRKSSAASSTTSVDSKFNVEDFGIKEYRSRKDSHAPSLTTSIPEVDESECEETPAASTRPNSKAETAEPKCFLQEFEFGLGEGKKEGWRFSTIELSGFKLESQST